MGLLTFIWMRKMYKQDCKNIGKENLAVSWWERVGAWLACGFWAPDVAIVAALVQILMDC